MHTLDADGAEAVRLAEAREPVAGVTLKVGGIEVLGLHERHDEVEQSAGPADTRELRHDGGGIGDVLEDGVADDRVEVGVLEGDVLQRRVDVDVVIVKTSLDVLIDQRAVHQCAYVP